MFTVLPSLSTPLPSTATACATGDGLSIVMVTLPAFALSFDLSNLSWPLGSAESLRLLEAPPAELPPLEPLRLGGGARRGGAGRPAGRRGLSGGGRVARGAAGARVVVAPATGHGECGCCCAECCCGCHVQLHRV